MKLQKTVIKRLEDRLGSPLHIPASVEKLSIDIFSVTGEMLSVNTLKRLVGILPYESSPRIQTLNILAVYLGCENWDMLQRDIADEISAFGKSERGIYAEDLNPGDTLELFWSPGRHVTLKSLGGESFKVKESEGAKIIKGDILKISHVVEGFPLMARDVMRNGKSLGNYTAASERGIEQIECRLLD